MNSRKERDDREAMPVFDESIFEPEKAVYAMGFTDSDIEEVVEYFRWLSANQSIKGETTEYKMGDTGRLKRFKK